MTFSRLLYPLVCTVFLVSCSFSSSFKPGGKGGNIIAKSILIPIFENNAAQGPTSLAVDFTEQVRDYYLSNTKLIVNSSELSDLALNIVIADFYAKPLQSSIVNGIATEMELILSIKVEYIDANNEQNNVTKTIAQNIVYGAELTLEEAQDANLETILELLTQKVFNETVARW